jgi:2-polyprenyl-3-methyl-5-hydroxy-6-metoxy-1,4-benzoquinol methylase
MRLSKENLVSTIQEKANKAYIDLVKKGVSKTEVAGRYSQNSGIEKKILESIFKYIQFDNTKNILDIGCGCGVLADLLINSLKVSAIQATFIDIPEVVEKLEIEHDDFFRENNSKVLAGIFPEVANKVQDNFDFILIYSVIHYTDYPRKMIDEAAKLLRRGGTLLVGDIPNVNKKARFLASPTGRVFDANYKGIPLDEYPIYKDQYDYLGQNESSLNMLLDDSFVLDVMKDYRNNGFDVNLSAQEEELPFSKTREDLVIKKL